VPVEAILVDVLPQLGRALLYMVVVVDLLILVSLYQIPRAAIQGLLADMQVPGIAK
jgi:hypothetical protein